MNIFELINFFFFFKVGSGDNYEEDEEEEEDYNESVTTISTPHPHRHHHGEEVELINGTQLLPSEVQYQLPSISFQNNYEDLISTPAFVSFKASYFQLFFLKKIK